MTPRLVLVLILALESAARAAAPYPDGHRERINGYTVLHVAGTPEQMGEQHGRLMATEVRRMIKDLVRTEDRYSYRDPKRLIEGAMKMEPFQPEPFRRELKALAKAAGVRYDELVTAQLFGDVNRAQLCTSFALFGPATATGECIVGRNMDYYDNGVSGYAALLLHCTPSDGGLPFVTVTWAGIINGWTAMNSAGLISSNNTAYARSDSLEGISTCFMLRKVVQFARNVDEGIRIVEAGPRACGTNLLIAGGQPPQAAIVEFDHEKVAVRPAEEGYVLADNSLRVLYQGPEGPYDWEGSRYNTLKGFIRKHYGRVDRTLNLAGAPGVPITYMNLHSAMLYPKDLSFRVAMGKQPACDQPYQSFRMTEAGIVAGPEGPFRKPEAPAAPRSDPLSSPRTRGGLLPWPRIP